jgi:hypothetical protein
MPLTYGLNFFHAPARVHSVTGPDPSGLRGNYAVVKQYERLFRSAIRSARTVTSPFDLAQRASVGSTDAPEKYFRGSKPSYTLVTIES